MSVRGLLRAQFDALAVLAAALVGSATLLHGVALSMDEFAASFQARIFASGRLQATVPAEWQGLAPWMTPVFVNYKPEAGVWVSSYLPIYAAIRTIFTLARVESLTNPVLAALTLLLALGRGEPLQLDRRHRTVAADGLDALHAYAAAAAASASAAASAM